MPRRITDNNGMVTMKLEDGEEAYIRYLVHGAKIIVDSTYTPSQHRGKGIASTLTEHLIENIVKPRSLKVVPNCSYTAEYFRKHSELKTLLY